MTDTIFHDAREVLLTTIQYYCTYNMDWGRLYKSIVDRQIHISRPLDFPYDPTNLTYIDSCRDVFKRYDHPIQVEPMISIGLTHADALYVCRKISKAFGIDLTSDYLSNYDVEEGEIENTDVFKLLDTIVTSEYLFPISVYDAVWTNALSATMDTQTFLE